MSSFPIFSWWLYGLCCPCDQKRPQTLLCLELLSVCLQYWGLPGAPHLLLPVSVSPCLSRNKVGRHICRQESTALKSAPRCSSQCQFPLTNSYQALSAWRSNGLSSQVTPHLSGTLMRTWGFYILRKLVSHLHVSSAARSIAGNHGSP